MSTIKKVLENSTKLISILAIALVIFAAWFAINFAKSKTKKEFDARQTYFNDFHQHFKKDWAQNAYWDSVKVENCTMSAGEESIRFQLSKKVFNDQFNVATKSLNRPDIYKVMNFRIQHGNDSVQAVADFAFLEMNSLVLHKASISHVASEGITFKEYSNTKSIISMKYNSYKDQEGIGQKVFAKDVLFFDQLFFLFRSINYLDTTTFNIQLLETQLIGGTGKFSVNPLTVQSSELDADHYQVVLSNANQEILYRFQYEKSYPNVLRAFEMNGKQFKCLNMQ